MIVLKSTGVFEIHVHFKMTILKREQMFLNETLILSDEIKIEFSKKLQNLLLSSIFERHVYLEPIQISKMELLVKIVNSLMPLNILTKNSILVV